MATHHFHYKHPLFGRGDWLNEPHKIKPTANGVRWDHSPYHVWFQCLLRNEGYKRYCQTRKGKEMTDEDAMKCIDYIRDNAPKYAEAKGQTTYLENYLKSKKALNTYFHKDLHT